MDLRGWISRFAGERRNLNDPTTPLTAASEWLWDALGARKSATGVVVTPDNSLEVSTVWCAVSQIARSVASLPLHVYARTPDGKQRAPEHPAYYLLHTRPNPELSSFLFRELLVTWLLLWGDFFAEVERNGRGDCIALWPIHPANVTVARIGGEKVYVVRVDGAEHTLPAARVHHVQGFGIDGQRGLVPIHVARNAVGLAKATETFGSQFFQQGAQPSGVLTHPGKLGKDASDNLRDSWGKTYGGLTNAHRLAVLEEGMSWAPLTIPNDAAQYLETRRFSVEEVARIFGIPLHMVGHLERMTFATTEQMAIQYVTACIEPLCKRIESELTHRLIGPGDRAHYAEFVLEGLLRGDSAARAAFYQSLFSMGAISPNELRERENMNRVEGGDARFVPLNMVELGAKKPEASDDA
jgi:HK97 family phage portal protein